MTIMVKRFIKKNTRRVYRRPATPTRVERQSAVAEDKGKKKKTEDMKIESLNQADAIIGQMEDTKKPRVKVVKKDKGLMEKSEAEPVVIMEDNRQVLTD